MSYNERIFNIITESSKPCKEKCSKLECDEACESFETTIDNYADFSKETIPTSAMKCPADAVPVCKGECKDECGNMCESFYVDSRFLDIYMEDNNIDDAADAVESICEFYGIDTKDMVVVFECDEINKGLIDHAKSHRDIGLLKKYDCALKNCINRGIRVAKKTN